MQFYFVFAFPLQLIFEEYISVENILLSSFGALVTWGHHTLLKIKQFTGEAES